MFNKWGIALFALLFTSSLKTQARPAGVHYRICDKCGKHSEYATTYDEAIKKANYQVKEDVCIAIDVAASEFYDKNTK